MVLCESILKVTSGWSTVTIQNGSPYIFEIIGDKVGAFWNYRN